MDLGGTPTVAPDKTLNPKVDDPNISLNEETLEALAEKVEKERLELLLQELQNKIKEDLELRNFKDQIQLDLTRDGLRIQIRDAENRPMFSLGSAQLQPYFEDILLAMSATLRSVPNKLSVSGHTDAKPFPKNAQFGNWELSANRANAARRTLVFGGYPEEQIARVVGYASTALFDRQNPMGPVNRRIEILVLTKKAQQSIEDSQQSGSAPDKSKETKPSTTPNTPAARPAADMQPAELRQRLNVFESGVLQFKEKSQKRTP